MLWNFLRLTRAWFRRNLTTSLLPPRAARLKLEILEERIQPATILWGNSSGGNWDTASNWVGGVVPGVNDKAVISTTAAATITIQTGDSESVLGLTTAANDTLSITGGALTVAASSIFSGPLTMTGGSLTASGTAATLTANGTTTVSNASLYATGGGQMSLPELTSFPGFADDNSVQADGTGSVLDLSALTSVPGQNGYDSVTLSATNGGELDLSGLTSLGDTNITDTNGSTILASNLTTLSGGGLTVDASTLSLPGLTEIIADTGDYEPSIEVSGGGSLSLPGMTSDADLTGYLRVDGTGSVLDLSTLTSVKQFSYMNQLYLQANNGGELNLSGLTRLSTTNTYGIGIADTGGSTILDGKLTTLKGMSVELDGTDTQVANAWSSATNCFFHFAGGSYSLPDLTNIDGSTVYVTGGGSLTLLGVTSDTGKGGISLDAAGSGSVVDLSALTSVTGSVGLEADNDGEVDASGLTSVGGAGIDAYEGGEVDVSGLTGLKNGSISDTKGSTVLDGNLTTLYEVYVTLDGTDPHVADTWTSLTVGSFSVTGGSYSLPGLTDVDGSNIQVSGGGTLSLPGVTSYAAKGANTISADGIGSVLDLSDLITVTKTSPGANLSATNGGEILLPLSQFVLTLDSPSVQGGTPDNFTLVAEDAFGNVLPGYTGTVSFSGSDGMAQFADANTGLPLADNSYTFTSADAGSHTFTVIDPQPGTLTITATDTPDDVTTTAVVTILTPSSSTAATTASTTFSTRTQNVTLSATVTSLVGTVNEGTLTFSILNGGTLIGTAVTCNVANGLATAPYALPASLAGGSYTIQAVYNGTVNFDSSTDSSQSLTVNAAATASAAASASATFSSTDQNVNLEATITSTGGVVNEGTETFTILNGTTVIGNPVTVDVSAGAASAIYPLPAGTSAGAYLIKDEYNGTTNFLGDTDESQLLTVMPAATSTSISPSASNANPSTYGQSLSFTATVADANTSGEPTGTVSFYNGSINLATLDLSAGSATFTPSSLAVGTYSITAAFNGSTDFASSSSDPTTPVLQTINPDSTSTTVAAAPNPAAFDQAITITATVTNTAVAAITPTGTATFQDVFNGVTTNLGTYNLVNGVATFTTSALAVGSHTITATYSGDTDFSGSTTTTAVAQTIDADSTSTTITASSSNPNPAIYGQSLSFTATVANTSGTGLTPAGTVSFYNGSTKLATFNLDAAGSATYTTSTLSAGSYSLTATFNGSTDFATSLSDPTAPVLQTIDTDNTATSLTASSSNPNPSTYGQALSFTATVANTSGTPGMPTGSVSFYNGATKLVTVSLVSGSATYTTSTLTAGSYSLTAEYNGSTDYAPSSSDPTTPVLQTIDTDNTATSLTASSSNPNPSTYGQSLSFTATVANTSGTPGTPTGWVSFYNGATKLVTISVVSGSATYTTATLPTGSYSLTANYNGTTDFAASSSDPTNPILQTINPASTTTTIAAAAGNLSPSSYGQSLSFTATVANASGTGQTPTGTVSFYNGATKLATLNLVAGSATYTSTTLAIGSYSLTASYNGTSDFTPSASDPTTPILQTINPDSTSTTVAAAPNPPSLGQAITFTATVANTAVAAITPMGKATFQDVFNGVTTYLGTYNLVNGVATFTTSALAVGSHAITATYSSDTDFFTSSSGTLLGGETVNPASTTIAVQSSPSPASFGQTVTYTATVTADSGTFDNHGTVQFQVDGSNLGWPVALSGGTASIQKSTLPVGSHTITATYSGDTDFSGSTTTTAVAQTIDADSTSTTITASSSNPNPAIYGQSLSFTATVANTSGTGLTPAGTVSFYNGSTKLATFNLDAAGSATYTTSDLSAGTYTLTATFNGSADFATSSSDPTTPVLQTIDAYSTSTSITASASNPKSVDLRPVVELHRHGGQHFGDARDANGLGQLLQWRDQARHPQPRFGFGHLHHFDPDGRQLLPHGDLQWLDRFRHQFVRSVHSDPPDHQRGQHHDHHRCGRRQP